MAVPVAVGATLCGLAVLWALVYLLGTAARLPASGEVRGDAKLATVIYARGGQTLARYYRENRSWVPLSRIAPIARKALISTEDHRFYTHGGVDWRRLVGAALQTAGGDWQGGSTITMQLARNRYPEIGKAPLLERKAKEVLMSLKMERAFSKKKILEAYFNTVSFGHGAFGIEAAAQTYFGVPAARLGPAQAATLVGMLKGTTRYSPTRHPKRSRARRNTVLGLMRRHGALPERKARRLQAEPLVLNLQRPSLADSPAPYFAEAVRRRLEDWADNNGYDLYTDGLQVHTTLDLEMQQQARAALRRQTEKLQAVAGYAWSRRRPSLLSEKIDPYVRRAKQGAFEPFARLWDVKPGVARRHARRTARYRRAARRGADPDTTLRRLLNDPAFMDSLRTEVARLEAGLVALDPQTGRVRAWVGGRSFAEDKYDHVALAQRQPGSTFKPFVWTSALSAGFAPDDRLVGFSLRNGLAYSSNRMALRLIRTVGPGTVARTAQRFGVQSRLRAVPSLALGTSEVTLLDMVSSYSTFAEEGFHYQPHLIGRIEDGQGRLLKRFAPKRRKVASRYTTYTTLDLMRGVIDYGTGADLRRRWGLREADLAGKTGTTQANADGWFLLVHPRLVTGAWVGFNDRQVAFRTEHWGHGSSNALRLVGDFFQHVMARRPSWAEARFRAPPGYREPRARRTLDSLYTGYGTDGGSYGAHPAESDHRVRDAFRQGLDSTRAGAAPHDRLARRAADPEAALRQQLRKRARRRGRKAGTPAEASPAPPAPAPIRTDSLDARVGTRHGGTN